MTLHHEELICSADEVYPQRQSQNLKYSDNDDESHTLCTVPYQVPRFQGIQQLVLEGWPDHVWEGFLLQCKNYMCAYEGEKKIENRAKQRGKVNNLYEFPRVRGRKRGV